MSILPPSSYFRWLLVCLVTVPGCSGTAISGIQPGEDGASGGSAGAGSEVGSGGRAPGAGGKPATVNPADGPLENACVASCKKERDCGRSISKACESDCVAGGSLFDERCQGLLATETSCSAGLDCAALDRYLNGRSGDPTCGAAFDAFAKACTFDSGVIPSECASYCQTALACNASRLEDQGCRESCLLSLTGLDQQYGKDCASVQQSAYGCFGKLTCDEMTALASGSVPASCADLQSQWNTTCR